MKMNKSKLGIEEELKPSIRKVARRKKQKQN